MRPLKGVVVNIGSTLDIRLESGLTIKSPLIHKKLHVGDSVVVSYDFTNRKIRRVLLENPNEKIIDIEEPISLEVPGLDDCSDEDAYPYDEDTELLVLDPVCDAWEERGKIEDYCEYADIWSGALSTVV